MPGSERVAGHQRGELGPGLFAGAQVDQRGGVGADGDQARAGNSARRAAFRERVAERREAVREAELFEGRAERRCEGHPSSDPVAAAARCGRARSRFPALWRTVSRMRSFVGGFVAAVVLLALVVFGAVETGAVPARADGALMPGEKLGGPHLAQRDDRSARRPSRPTRTPRPTPTSRPAPSSTSRTARSATAPRTRPRPRSRAAWACARRSSTSTTSWTTPRA